ncbi:MAG TPA: MarR family transcriptional regulator [Burkholderiaceae bacterium]|nr:MarR family transcriptional regulator [Burkholderiaceae bacterium]HRA79453.1 MarR family transcriptional regulator [Burkholderiaceae bacterium]
MSLEQLNLKPGHLIRRAQQIAVAVFMDECGRFDVTPVQYAALTAIGVQPDIDATRLSQLIALDRSTTGSVLERLEAKALVQRNSSPEDRRIKLLRLSDSGRALLREVEAAVERAQQRIVAPLQPDERKTFLRLLARLVESNNALSRAPAGLDDRLGNAA